MFHQEVYGMYRLTHVVGLTCILLAGGSGVVAGEKYGAKCTFIAIGKHKGFILLPAKPAAEGARPWIWYAPTIGSYPNKSNEWILRKLLDRGFYVCGVDVGESYGSPAGRTAFSEYHQHVVREYKLETKARLLAQSRGGLMLYNWAAENPDKVRCIVGIYPVCDLRSYPGLNKAAGAYGMTPAELEKQLTQHNPIDRLEPLAKAGVPILHIHGDADAVVPLEKNSQIVLNRYGALGGKMKLIVVAGKGHAEIAEYFQEPRLVQFLTDGGFLDESSKKKDK
jgi:pimeloyl-ACP methyl ester carboxylesterase